MRVLCLDGEACTHPCELEAGPELQQAGQAVLRQNCLKVPRVATRLVTRRPQASAIAWRPGCHAGVFILPSFDLKHETDNISRHRTLALARPSHTLSPVKEIHSLEKQILKFRLRSPRLSAYEKRAWQLSLQLDRE